MSHCKGIIIIYQGEWSQGGNITGGGVVFFAVDEGGLTFPFRNPVKHLFSQKKKKDARHNCLVIACRLPPSAHDLGEIFVSEN